MTLRLTTSPPDIAEAARILAAGGLVAFPTETVYGLGGDATHPESVARIYAAKGRPAFNPLIAHVASLDAAMREGEFSVAALALARRFWPGPLTIVVPVTPGCTVCELARAGLASVGLRVPSHPAALALLEAFGRPLAGPSANRSGHVSPTTAEHVLADLGGRIGAVLDGGPANVGIESTIVGCLDDRVYLLRPGRITRAEIEAVTGRTVEAQEGDEKAPQSPGRLASHYAPRAKVRLDAKEVLPGEAWLAFGPGEPPGSDHAVASMNLSSTADLLEAAANLYRCLRQLDATGAAGIAVSPIPSEGLGEAVMDRLSRAASA